MTTKPTNLDKINKALEESGVEGVSDADPCPERTAYLEHYQQDTSGFDAEDFTKWNKKLKYLREQYVVVFYTYFAQVYPHLLFELEEDKVYWNYNEQTGIYDEMNFTMVRGLVIKLLTDEGLVEKATEATAKSVLGKYRGNYSERGKSYNDFDANSHWFHASNGWVNVHTLKFKDHAPERLSRRVSAVAYDPEATCPTYDAFLDEQVQLQEDQVKVLDQFSGLLLTPDISKQKMLVIIGEPGSGKSTLMDCWSDILGDCATQTGLHEIASDSFRFGGSTLVGKHLCWFDEVEVTRSNMGNSLINLITGQHIRVERKGINGIVEADNNLKCVLTANTLPRSAEMGVYRRMILMYFTYSFTDNLSENRNMRTLLNDEASGILNRMLRGLASLEKNNGFSVIEGHDDLIEEYKASSNTVAEFLTEHFVFNEDAEPIKAKVMLDAYKEFSTDRYSDSLTPQRFGVLLKQNGLSEFRNIISKKDRLGNKEWCGLQLKENYEVNPAGFIREKDVDF